MAFQISPGVLVTERDLTSIIPAVATTTGGFAGPFRWGPVLQPTTISSENELAARFGGPVTGNAASWFTAANFLGYSNNLLTVRVASAGQLNAVASSGGTAPLGTATVSAAGTGFTDIPTVTISGGTGSGGTATATLKVVSVTVAGGGTGWAVNDTATINIGSGVEATFTVASVGAGGAVTGLTITQAGSYTDIIAGSLSGLTASVVSSASGTSLTVNVVLGLNTVTVSGGSYTVAPSLSANGSNGGTGSTITVALATVGIVINNEDDYETNYANGAGSVGEWAAKYPGALGNSIVVSMADSNTFTGWTATVGGRTINCAAEFDAAPGTSEFAASVGATNDELHVIVFDKDGQWTGTPGAILEKFAFVSKASNARKADGTNNYYKNAINTTSKYIWWMDNTADGTNWGSVAASGVTFANMTAVVTRPLAGGVDDLSPNNTALIAGFTLFADVERFDVSLIPTGPVNSTVAKSVIQIAADRKDCIAFASPSDNSGAPILSANTVTDTVAFRTNVAFNVNSSYGVLDSGWKYQYDRYNDVYRWVPLNGDVAGLCARTDLTNDPWFSPGGFNRGQIKNVVKLSFNPNQAQRDLLYKNGINPVVSFPGQGTVLYGDKTLLTRPSAFDRINVRRLFIVLEKAIATAAKFQLFEFNDDSTRSQFRAIVEPFLRDVQGRRGITDFRVKCDTSNNTGEVIDRNEFVADIFIKPARSINFITLNFIAARSSISFDEIGA